MLPLWFELLNHLHKRHVQLVKVKIMQKESTGLSAKTLTKAKKRLFFYSKYPTRTTGKVSKRFSLSISMA
jgi:hypothetical protein